MISRLTRRPTLWCSLFTISLVAGCGGADDGIALTNVSGKATFKGSPIVYGQVDFIPDANSETSSPAGFAEIVDGVYNTETSGKGIVPGSYQIRVTAYPSRPEAPVESANDEPVEPSVKPLFVGYTLTAQIDSPEHNIEVPAEAEGFNLFDSTSRRNANIP